MIGVELVTIEEFYDYITPSNWKSTPEQTRHLENETTHHNKSLDNMAIIN